MSEQFLAGRQPLIGARNGTAPRILLAEDSPAARILTAALLRRMGCAVDEAENGEEAFEAAAAEKFDVIILDIEMPVMDGIAAARAIRALGGERGQTPMVALSAFLADTAQSRHWLSLFDLIHAKPASREGLRRVIERMLARGQRDATPAGAEMPLSITGNPAASLIDHEAIAMMRQQFPPADWCRLMDSALAEMQEGFAAISEAHARADKTCIRGHSHRVKGLARTFAAPRLAKHAEHLERDAANAERPRDLGESVEALRDCLDHTVAALRKLCAA